MNETMSQADYAKHRGVSGQAVSKYVQHGKIPPEAITMEKDPDGKTRKKIIVRLADEALERNLNPSKSKGRRPKGAGGAEKVKPKQEKVKPVEMSEEAIEEFKRISKAAGVHGMSLQDAQLLQARAKAVILSLEAKKKEKALMKVADCEYQAARMAEMIKAALSNTAEHIGSIYGGGKKFEMVQALTKEFNRILNNIADEVERESRRMAGR